MTWHFWSLPNSAARKYLAAAGRMATARPQAMEIMAARWEGLTGPGTNHVLVG